MDPLGSPGAGASQPGASQPGASQPGASQPGLATPPANPKSPLVPERSNSQSSSHRSGHIPAHRTSFAETHPPPPPPSPRPQRPPSFTQQAVQDLLNRPPTHAHQNPRFAGRDWRNVAVGELASLADVSWAELD